MKKYLFTIVITAISVIAMSAVPAVNLYQEYIEASEELLWDLEEMCEANGIHWGDTICEGDTWAEYCEVREQMGIGPLEHCSKRRN